MASTSESMSAAKGGSGAVSTPANNVGESTAANRRGSSGSQSGGLFSGLMNQKRNSGDAAAAARRQSFNEQKPATGIIGSMWNKFTTGHNADK